MEALENRQLLATGVLTDIAGPMSSLARQLQIHALKAKPKHAGTPERAT
jgi:hypothetical protein